MLSDNIPFKVFIVVVADHPTVSTALFAAVREKLDDDSPLTNKFLLLQALKKGTETAFRPLDLSHKVK